MEITVTPTTPGGAKNRWVGFALSSDQKMGGDMAFYCTADYPKVYQAANAKLTGSPYPYPITSHATFINQVITSGVFTCSFAIPVNLASPSNCTLSNAVASVAPGGLNQLDYLLLATGPSSGPGKISVHNSVQISPTKLRLNSVMKNGVVSPGRRCARTTTPNPCQTGPTTTTKTPPPPPTTTTIAPPPITTTTKAPPPITTTTGPFDCPYSGYIPSGKCKQIYYLCIFRVCLLSSASRM